MNTTSRISPIAAALSAVAIAGAAFAAGRWIQTANAPSPRAAPETTMRVADPTQPAGRTAIDVAPATLEHLGVRVEAARREALEQPISAVATIVPDESRLSHVHARVSGWIEQLDVNTTGEAVRAGQPLARVFSQELLASQIEYLAARRAFAASGLTSAVTTSGRARLHVLGMTEDEIAAIEATGEPRRVVTVVAPRSGTVVNRGVTVGTAVDPGTTLLTIADLSQVWVFAEVPEIDARAVKVGTPARLDFPASGRPPLSARVDFIYPTLTERTRTLRARFTVANPAGVLRPGLYGTALFSGAAESVLTVPRDAVVDTGPAQHVFVVAGEQFVPRLVTLGAQRADRVEIRSGVTEGEIVVAAGVFLLDSESRLRATGGGASHAHSTPAAAAPKPSPADPHAAHRK